MKINVLENGIATTRDMTANEVAKYERSPHLETITPEQRIEALEAAVLELIMGGGNGD